MKYFFEKVCEKYSLVVANFKTVKNKFINQGEDPDEVEKYLELFKKVRDKNKLESHERDINFWSKRSFSEFVNRITELDKTPTKRQRKRGLINLDKKVNGADKIAENEDWVVFHVKTNDAAEELGQGTSWCIQENPSEFWNDDDICYFIISKKPRDDEWSKIALVNGGYWDADNNERDSLPKKLKIPKFKLKTAKKYLIGGVEYKDINSLPENLIVDHLEIASEELTRLPDNLTVHKDLSIWGNLVELPKGLKVGGNLNANGCKKLKKITADLKVGGDLILSDCSSLEELPDNLKVPGDLNLIFCTKLKKLPLGLQVGGLLDLSGCNKLKELPPDLKVRHVYLPISIT